MLNNVVAARIKPTASCPTAPSNTTPTTTTTTTTNNNNNNYRAGVVKTSFDGRMSDEKTDVDQVHRRNQSGQHHHHIQQQQQRLCAGDYAEDEDDNEDADTDADADDVARNSNAQLANETDILDYNTSKESIDTENNIRQMQELIEKLNFEIFRNPQNYTRPPSEYLEIFNTLTEQLHHLQIKKQILDQSTKQHKMLTASATSSSTLQQQQQQQTINNNNNNNNKFTSNREKDTSSWDGGCNDSTPSTSANACADANMPPRVPKLNHPTTLATTTSTSSSSMTPAAAYANNSKRPSNPQIMAWQSPSPATTATHTHTHSRSVSSSYSSPFPPPTISSFSTSANAAAGAGGVDHYSSPPLSQPPPSLSPKSQAALTDAQTPQSPYVQQYQQHQQMAHNSRSFLDINEAAAVAGQSSTAKKSSNGFSSSSAVATPIAASSSTTSSFLRIYIGSSTTVIEKRPIPLREALFSKLKSRNLDIEKCIVFLKENNLKIDWNIDVSTINSDNLVVNELSDELRHSFEKKTFTIRSCSCKKRFFNVYACIKCDYIICQRNECRSRGEKIACMPKRVHMVVLSAAATSASSLAKTDLRAESPGRGDTAINISQQILPVNQLKVNIPSRDRSRSETELDNIFADPMKVENNQPVQATLSAKSSVKYGVMPRNQYSLATTTSQGISGSVNEGSGSVISSMKNGSLSASKPSMNDSVSSTIQSGVTSLGVKTPLSRQYTPSRRDSFNTWEIPCSQIKIDMNSKVGSGSFGIVHRGRDFYHDQVAVKFLNVQNPTLDQSNAFRNEVAILKSTRHDNILLFIGCILKSYLAIVTEWCPGSSLYRHLHVEDEYWEMNHLIDIAKQTATGMEYLHARDILHRDLKSNNIFLIPKETSNSVQPSHHFYNQRLIAAAGANHQFDSSAFLNLFGSGSEVEKWKVKIGDFGLATVKSSWAQSSSPTSSSSSTSVSSSSQAAAAAAAAAAAKKCQPTGSILWMAPEVIRQKVTDPYTQKSDVYSYGVVLYELFTGHLPYDKKEQNMIIFMVGTGRLKLDPNDARKDTPDELKELIAICSKYDRDERLNFVQINERLKKIKPTKSRQKLQRALSLPNLMFVPQSLNVSHFGVYEDDTLYPTTPTLKMMMSSKAH